MSKLTYPNTPATSETEVLAGVSFPDPYHWLEQDTDAVRQWQDAQNRIADEWVKSWPGYAEVTRSVSRYFVDRVSLLPRFACGYWFRAQQRTAPEPACVMISRTPFGSGARLALTSGADEEFGYISWIAPSPNARTLAVGVCADGSESNRIRLIDVETGARIASAPPHVLMDAWMGGACWLPDSSGFYFLARDESSKSFRQTVFFHDVASGTQTQAAISATDSTTSDYTLVTVSCDGQHLLASYGLFAPKPIAIRSVQQPNSPWLPFVRNIKGSLTGFVKEGRFIGITDIDAPRGRIVSIPVEGDNPEDVSRWTELFPESEMVLRSVTPVGQYLYVTGFVDTYSRVKVLTRDGVEVGEVPLPDKGAVVEPIFPLMSLVPNGHPQEYYFAFSSFRQSWGVYRHISGLDGLETVREPEVRLDDVIVSDHWAVAQDGTRVPYHAVRLARVDKALPAPALVYGYGAFNLPLVPEYPGAMAGFIAAGGVFVHCHIRGGAELGLDWWRAGRMQNKQNGYRDLYAIAEDLLAKGITTREQLAMTGRSNGGLMAGVALTQRPELWKAIVAQVPVMDLIAMPRDPYGRYALASEFGDPDDPADVVRMAGFSPYHLVDPQTTYPAVWIEAGATDPRCPAWHARKFAARLQSVTRSANPVLVRVREKAGHGFATDKKIQNESYAGWLVFLMRELGMEPEQL